MYANNDAIEEDENGRRGRGDIGGECVQHQEMVSAEDDTGRTKFGGRTLAFYRRTN